MDVLVRQSLDAVKEAVDNAYDQASTRRALQLVDVALERMANYVESTTSTKNQ